MHNDISGNNLPVQWHKPVTVVVVIVTVVALQKTSQFKAVYKDDSGYNI